MLIIFSEHKMITFFLLLFFLISILCQIISGVIYQNMIKQSENMSETENKLLKLCKQKYAGYYKLNGRILNTSVFVDKFLQKSRLWGISLYRFPHISGQFMMLSVLMAGIASCLILAAGGSLFQIIPYYLLCILGLYLYFSVSGIIDLQEKKKILKVNLMDYLENHYFWIFYFLITLIYHFIKNVLKIDIFGSNIFGQGLFEYYPAQILGNKSKQ